ALQTMMISPGWSGGTAVRIPLAEDLAFFVTVAMAAFAMLFGTRHIDTTEHQDGLMMAVAVESIVKLVAFIAVGGFVTFAMMGGIGPLIERATASTATASLFGKGFAGGTWLTQMLLAMIAIVLLPRQFHVAVVENANRNDLRRARWLFPLYLIAINLFVVPIAVAGLLLVQPANVDGDTFVLALPVMAGSQLFALIAFLGGLSAATAMVIVEAVALSIMVCNNLVMPIMLRRHVERSQIHHDMGRRLIAVRRAAIAVILLLAYSYYKMIGSTAALAQIGLISFAAVAQFAPAFFGGLIWRRGTALGAMAGIIIGFALWAYTLFLPAFADAGWIDRALLDEGPFGLSLLRPRMLFNFAFDPLTHGVLWSLLVNTAAYIGLSLLRAPTPVERMQANAFVAHDIPLATAPRFRLWRTAITIGEVEATVARYLGTERAARAFAEAAEDHEWPRDPHAEADIGVLRFAEHLLARAVGTASSRLVMALLLERHSKNPRGAMKLLDDASAAIQYNRDLLQSAIDNVGQGIAVFDREQGLVCWNRRFIEVLGLRSDLGRVGAPLAAIVQSVLSKTGLSNQSLTVAVEDHLAVMTQRFGSFRARLAPEDRIVEIHATPIPEGGIVASFADVTQLVRAAEDLKSANESLERRVAERTAELTTLNNELARAKSEAETANLGKTKFIAAASHDILQPLNAARLFTSSLVERKVRGKDGELVRNIDASLEAVEDILSALLDISRLDAGALKAEITNFRLDDMFNALKLEFGPAARERGLSFKVVACSKTVKTDRKLLRRILQNLISNAIKYTKSGGVLMGCRLEATRLRIEVHDTGPGIPEKKQRLVFQEFQRLQDKSEEPGLGLGLAIVDRIAKMLGHPVSLRSKAGHGSTFSITVPLGRAEREIRGEPRASIPRFQGIGQLTVLVIDNETAILDGMRALLAGWGAEVIAARSAAEAIRLSTEHTGVIHAVLADYHLHRDDGLRVIEKLRRQRGHLPAILITADRSRHIQDEAAALGVQYLRKPVKPAALRASLAQLTRQAAE
ncbi:MAG: NahK/ErcS family hybrid sensor histidine kinase/response regulator, partial [Hyphomicrobiaceae bacterium]